MIRSRLRMIFLGILIHLSIVILSLGMILASLRGVEVVKAVKITVPAVKAASTQTNRKHENRNIQNRRDRILEEINRIAQPTGNQLPIVTEKVKGSTSGKKT